MEMFLMGLCLSLLGVAVCAMAFGAATRQDAPAEPPQPQVALPAPQFFIDAAATDAAVPRVPIEVLLFQLERHVRLEQAAAESFLIAPTLESLHTRTTSPLVH